jgi:hypothetical protein
VRRRFTDIVSSTERAADSELSFVDRGVHELKGVPAEWRVFNVA